MEPLTLETGADLGALFDSHSAMVFGFLLSRCGDRTVAEDLTGETFLAAGRLVQSGRGEEVTASWLRTVARRRLIDHWRRLSTRRRGLERLTATVRDTDPPAGDPEGRVQFALDSLSERQRAALVLRYLDDFSTSEVAEALGSSYKATESLLARARKAFKTAYEEQFDG